MLVSNYLKERPSFKKKVENYQSAAELLNLEESLYCLFEMSEGCFQWYEMVAKACKNQGIKRVFDIGANLGIQRYFFEVLGIEYIPVDCYEMANLNGCLDGLINKKYPFNIHTKESDALISHLCIGYLVEFKVCYKHLLEFNHLFFDAKMPNDNKKYKEIQLFHRDYGRIYFYKKERLL